MCVIQCEAQVVVSSTRHQVLGGAASRPRHTQRAEHLCAVTQTRDARAASPAGKLTVLKTRCKCSTSLSHSTVQLAIQHLNWQANQPGSSPEPNYKHNHNHDTLPRLTTGGKQHILALSAPGACGWFSAAGTSPAATPGELQLPLLHPGSAAGEGWALHNKQPALLLSGATNVQNTHLR